MKIWACISQKGGAGKTTIALHLAIIAQNRGVQSVLVDVDPQKSAETWGKIRGAMPPTVVATIVPSLPRTLDALRKQGVELVVIDTSPRANREAIEVASQANLVILPVRPSILDINATNETLYLLRDISAPKVAVLNAVPSRTTEASEAAEVLSQMKIELVAQLGDRTDYRRALSTGRGITEYAPNSKAAREIISLYDELVAR